jgi:hypothetical protein
MQSLSHLRPVLRRGSAGLAAAAILLAGAPAATADGVIQFADQRLAIREGNVGYITVVRSGGSTGKATALLTTGGNARRGTDYEFDLPLGTVEIEDGELFTHIEVEALGDNNDEGTLFANFALSQANGATLGVASGLILDLLDNDNPDTEMSFAGNNQVLRVREGRDLQVDVDLTGQEIAAEVDTAGQSGTATLGVDYTDVSATLQFDQGQTRRSFDLMTIQDDELEGTETLTLVLANPSPDQAAVGGTSRLVLIEDDEPGQPGEFTLTAPNGATVPEDGVSIELLVTRERGDTGEVTVDFVTADGTDSDRAVAGEDYTAATGTLTFPTGVLTQGFTIDILDDDQPGEQMRVFDVYIVNPTGLSSIDPDGARVSVFIEENDGNDDDDDCDRFCSDCFIATAAWGSWMHPHVVSLRRFRDDVLLQVGPGRALVAAYYRYSPPLAAIIEDHDLLRGVTRALLTPLVLSVEHPRGALAFLLMLWLGIRLRRRLATGRSQG